MPDVLFEIRNQIAHLTLNRPDKLNAFNRSMAMELQDQLLACDEDDSVRAVLSDRQWTCFLFRQDLSEFPADRLPDFEKVIDEYYTR
ncbi:MAG: enoyl-CoA hydratase-related protein [Puia sp.]